MNIILIDQEEVTNNRIVLIDRRSDHIRKILGAKPGDTLRTGLINGPIGTSKILSIQGNAVEIETSQHVHQPERPKTDIILALPRPIMLKRILSQAATMGVERIFLINAARVEKSFFAASLLQNNNFYQYLLQGLEQAVDTLVPQLFIHKRFKPFIEDFLPENIVDNPVLLVAHPGHFPSLAESVSLPLKKKTFVAIGPEGGWVDYEIKKFQQKGFLPFTMGPRILRVDTAVPAILSQIDLLRNIKPKF